MKSRITAIHLYQFDLPVRGPAYRMALSALTCLDTTLVEIVCENGMRGYGEVCPLGDTYQPAHATGARAAIKTIAPHLIGMYPIQIKQCLFKMDLALCGHAYAKAALDMALWDLSGKLLNLSVCDLLGGAGTPDVPSYYAIGINTPDGVAAAVKEKQNQGYRRIQIKVGGRDIEQDIEVAHKAFEVREKGTKLVLDANRSLSTLQAIQLSNACKNLNFILEQPCDTYEETKALKGRVHHPIFLDESATDLQTISKAIHENVADGFGMKITRAGGLSPMATIRDLCQAFHKPITCDDSWGGDICAAACIHMAATLDTKNLDGVWIASSYIKGHYDEENPIKAGPKLKVPEGSGLGVSPNTDAWNHVASFG